MTHEPDRPDHEMEDDIPECIGIGIGRCDSCNMIHMGMLNEDEDAICEMTLDDGEVVQLAMRLLQVVYPAMDIARMQRAIGVVMATSSRTKH